MTDKDTRKVELMNYIHGSNVECRYPSVTMAIECITPAVAAKMLERNTCNRKMKKSSVRRAIERGEWVLNGATIVFDKDGNLRDGQNRLKAIADSGIACDSVVVRGVEGEAQMTMDSGTKRSVGDFLQMAGYKEVNNVAAIGTGLYILDKSGIERCVTSHSLAKDEITTRELFEYTVSIYESRIKPIQRPCINTCRAYKLAMRTIAPLYDLFARTASYDDMQEFYDQLCGISAQCQPVQKLAMVLSRNMAIDNKAKLSTRIIGAYFIKVWNAYMDGSEIDKLSLRLGGARPERFPEVASLEMLS